MFAYIMSTVSALLSTLNGQRMRFQQQQHALDTFCSAYKLPQALANKLKVCTCELCSDVERCRRFWMSSVPRLRVPSCVLYRPRLRRTTTTTRPRARSMRPMLRSLMACRRRCASKPCSPCTPACLTSCRSWCAAGNDADRHWLCDLGACRNQQRHHIARSCRPRMRCSSGCLPALPPRTPVLTAEQAPAIFGKVAAQPKARGARGSSSAVSPASA